MGLEYNNFQVQDSVLSKQIRIDIKEPEVTGGLNIKRSTIEITTTDTNLIDSARIVKPKPVYRPVVKTIPQIPVTDTVEHPYYNITDNNFFLNNEVSFFDGLHFTPYNPSLSIHHIGKSTNQPTGKKHVEKVRTEIVTKDQDFATKSKLKTSTGFISTDWMLAVIIFSLIVFSWIRVGYSRYYQIAIKASYDFFTARRIIEEVNVTRNRVFYLMTLFFYINISMFITQYLEYQHIVIFNQNGLLLYLMVFASILSLYLAKSTLFSLFGFLFLGKKGFSTYIFTVFLYNKMIGIVLLPIISILPYVPDTIAPWVFYAGFFVIILLYILRIFRGLQISFKNRLSIFYLILYLCALEIMPTLILFKVIVNYLQ